MLTYQLIKVVTGITLQTRFLSELFIFFEKFFFQDTVFSIADNFNMIEKERFKGIDVIDISVVG